MTNDRDARFAAARDELRAEFNDPIKVWGRSGEDAWDTVLGMLAHTGWEPPRKDHPPHEVDVMRMAVCTVCGRDVQWDDDTEEWKH